MSRSIKKPVCGNQYMSYIAGVSDDDSNAWKRQYNRNMRRRKRQQVAVLSKTPISEMDADETQFIDKPAQTHVGNEFSAPGDGKCLHDANSEYSYKKPWQWKMK